MGRESTNESQEPLEQPAEGARTEGYEESGSVTPLQEPAEGAPEDVNAPPAADTDAP